MYALTRCGRPEPPAGIKIGAVRAEHSLVYVWRKPATNKDKTHPGGDLPRQGRCCVSDAAPLDQ